MRKKLEESFSATGLHRIYPSFMLIRSLAGNNQAPEISAL
jgi:hypothetical protein